MAVVVNVAVVLVAGCIALVESFGLSSRSTPRRSVVARVRRGIHHSPRAALVVGTTLATSLVLAVLWGLEELPLPFTVRMLVLLVGLAAITVADVRTGVVPYLYLAVLAAVRLVAYVPELLVDARATLLVVRGELVTALIIVVLLGLVRLTQRGGLGWGDIWILALLPLFLGPRLALLSILASFVVAFGFSLWALISRRKSRRDSFPLAPAILVGVTTVLVYATFGGSSA